MNNLREQNKDKLAKLNLPMGDPNCNIMIWETYKTKLQPGLVDVTFYQAGTKEGYHGFCTAQVIKQVAGDNVKLYYTTNMDEETIDFCISNNIRIINASLHTAVKDSKKEAMFKRYYEWGGILVAAVGNYGDKSVRYPASSIYSIAVSATNTEDCNGPEIDITVDSNWWTYLPNGTKHIFGGTSCATPVITGCVAHILGIYPEWDLDKVKEFLQLNSTPGNEPYERVFSFPDGFGGESLVKEHIVLHHSATSDGIVYKDFDSLLKGHLARGFRDIGYHWVIERLNGELVAIPGRAEWDTGAHCPGKNEDGIGVCVVGNFEKEVPSEELYQFVAKHCRGIISRHPIKSITGHYDHCPTLCPGKNFDVEKVKQLVYRKEETPLEKIKVKIGDKEVTGLLIQLPGEVNATTYVPIRAYNDAVVESLKAAVDEVIWNNDTRTVEVK